MLIPLFLVLWLITGLAGIATGGRFLHNLQYLSSDTAVSLEKKNAQVFLQVLQHLRPQLDFLVAVVLQNCHALELLVESTGGTCL